VTQEASNSLWTDDERPACNDGMTLLKEWADSNPSNVSLLPDIKHADLFSNPFASGPLWRLYTRHVSTCPACKSMQMSKSPRW
jgi:hypothetical protein